MKKILCYCLFYIFANQLIHAQTWQEQYDELLSKYVQSDGVDYQSWHESSIDLKKLQSVVDQIAIVKTKKLSAIERKAFYINAYNAWMLQLVFENYPITSVKEIGKKEFSVFSDKLIVINNKKTSLDILEKKTLLKEFPDSRIHFAVNCASGGCPPLLNVSYRADRLEQQLDASARTFLSSDQGVVYTEGSDTIAVSSLLNWYQKDFLADSPEGIIAYLNQYRKETLADSLKIIYLPYDWQLNAVQ